MHAFASTWQRSIIDWDGGLDDGVCCFASLMLSQSLKCARGRPVYLLSSPCSTASQLRYPVTQHMYSAPTSFRISKCARGNSPNEMPIQRCRAYGSWNLSVHQSTCKSQIRLATAPLPVCDSHDSATVIVWRVLHPGASLSECHPHLTEATSDV